MGRLAFVVVLMIVKAGREQPPASICCVFVRALAANADHSPAANGHNLLIIEL